MLSEELQAKREGKVTASMAPAIMAGDTDRMMEMYEVAIGKRPPPKQNWPMKLGSHCGPFILDYHQEKTGQPITEREAFIEHPTLPGVSATLDGWRASDDCVIDAKCINSYTPIEDIVKYYTAQIIVQQRCRGSARGSLLIMHGTAEPREYEVEVPPPIRMEDGTLVDYEAKLWERMLAFQLCCSTFTPPSPVPAIVPPSKWRSIDLDNTSPGDWPNWGRAMEVLLVQWEKTKDAADTNTRVAKEIRELLPDDVGRVDLYGVRVRRSKSNAITVMRRD